MIRIKFLALIMTLFLISCGEDDPVVVDDNIIQADAGASDKAVLEFINVEDGGVIEFGEGRFTINQALIMSDKSNITIKGQGADKTTLDFAGQTSGGESIKISEGTDISLCGFTVLNGVSDAIKTQNVDGIGFYDISVDWEGNILTNNGNYGIYPVLCNNVEIDGCYARGAADAGIYVGQSTNIVVKNTLVEQNVAGIEIENCIGADVHNNTMQNNSGGILVYDLGNITSIRNGSRCRIFDNTVTNNNHANYSPNPDGLIGRLPVGTGIILLATDSVEIFGNTITHNNIAPIAMASYEFTGENFDPETGYDPRLRSIDIHDNVITRDDEFPDDVNTAASEIAFLTFLLGPDKPEIIYDGITGEGTLDDQLFRFLNNGDIKMANFNLQLDATGNSSEYLDFSVFDSNPAITTDPVDIEQPTGCN